MATTEVTIKFGDKQLDGETYALVKTTAPREYDYGGVLEYYNDGSHRFILVPTTWLASQEGRNRSGLYSFEFSDMVPAGAIAEDLWRRFLIAMEPNGK